MFLNRKGNSPAAAAPLSGPNALTGRGTTTHPPAPPPLHGASAVAFGAMSLVDAVDAAEPGPRRAHYKLLERVFDGLSAVKDVLDRAPPAGSVGQAEFAQALLSAFQGLDLQRVIHQLATLVAMRGDVDRLALNQLKDALASFGVMLNDARAALSLPEPTTAELTDAVSAALQEASPGLQGQLEAVLSSIADVMTASLAADTEASWMATSRSVIEVPASETLPLTVRHGIEGMQTILDKALQVKDEKGNFEAFIKLRRDLQEFDLFELGQDLADKIDVRPEILHFLTLVGTTGRVWDDRLDVTWVEDHWDAIETAMHGLATALGTAGGTPPAAATTPPALPNDADGARFADLLFRLEASQDRDNPRLRRIAQRFLEPGSCAELGIKLGDKANSIGKWAFEIEWTLATGSEIEAARCQQRLALELAEIGFISWGDILGSPAPPSQGHWDELLRVKAKRTNSKAVAQLLGDTLRLVKSKGALAEGNVSKAVTYLDHMLSGIDIVAVAADPRLEGFDLLHHIGQLEGAVERVNQAYLAPPPKASTEHADISPMQNSMRLVLRALMIAGIIPEEVLPAFFSSDWPSVPGIGFDAYPAPPRTGADAMALVADAVGLGGLDPDIPEFVAQWIGPPDETVLEHWSSALEKLQAAILFARSSARPLDHEHALLDAIEDLMEVLVPGFRSRTNFEWIAKRGRH